MTARSRERGSHAGRPRGNGLPFPLPGDGAERRARASPGTPAAQRAAAVPRGGGSRHRKPPERRKPVAWKAWLSRKHRLAAVFVLAAGALGVGFNVGFGTEASAEPTVQAFLLDWQQGDYAQAAALTDGDGTQVAAELAATSTDLDATNMFFSMSSVEQLGGGTAEARFHATADLAQAGEQWSYTGRFRLSRHGGRWLVQWSPAVINPRLAAGDRLAVVTTFPPRAQVEDMTGKPLGTESGDYHVGVYPGRLANPALTADKFGHAAKLNVSQVLGQINSAPPGQFLSLLTLERGAFKAQWPKLSKAPGLDYRREKGRLFTSIAEEAVGKVGTENAAQLRAEGAAYQPGTTIGLTGLEQVYQEELTGTPTTSVVVADKAGRTAATLWSSAGHRGMPVRTTLSSRDQAAATHVLASRPGSGEIVAVDSRTGAIRALASLQKGSRRLPAGGALNGKVAPGMAFSIVSAAALLSAGVAENQSLPCEPRAYVGGTPFTYRAVTSQTNTFASDFAVGCGTALAQLSQTLSPGQLASAERAFGIGASWHLRLPAFSGSASAASGEAGLAAQAIGQSGVLMSPLGMAMVAAEVASGSGRAPVLVADPSSDATSTDAWRAPLSASGLGQLRHLMQLAVASPKAPAHAADVAGAPVYGQAGVVKIGKKDYLSWFVGYRGDLAVAVLETGSTARHAAASLAGAFFKAVK